jgi:hypothetical protein
MGVDASIDNKTPPTFQVNNLDGVTVLSRLADLMTKYPPHPNDYPMLLRLRSLGIEPGKPFDPAQLDPETISIINSQRHTRLYAGDKVNGVTRRAGTRRPLTMSFTSVRFHGCLDLCLYGFEVEACALLHRRKVDRCLSKFSHDLLD